MKEIIREYGMTMLSVTAAFGIVKVMEYVFLGSNGLIKMLVQIYTIGGI